MTTPTQSASQPVAAQQSLLANLRAQVLAMLAAAFTRPGSWRDGDLEQFLRTALPLVQAGQRQTAAITAAYLQQMGRLHGVTLAVPPLDELSGSLRGVDPAQVYARPFQTVWTDLSQGQSLDAAVAKGEQRLKTIAATDLQLAKTHTSHRMLSTSDRIVGYERVLEGPSSCGLCVIASTQRYHTGDLMPIHANCDCSVEPIFGTKNPARVIHEDRLVAANAEIAARLGHQSYSPADLKHQVVVHQHGELGPVLTVRDQHFASH